MLWFKTICQNKDAKLYYADFGNYWSGKDWDPQLCEIFPK